MKINTNIKKYITGVLLGLGVMAVLVCSFALVMLIFKTDRAYSAFFATVSVSAGAYASSFYLARKTGSKGYLFGLSTGLAYFLAVTVVSLIITKSRIGSNTAFHFVIIMLSSTIGGIMGVNRKKSKIL